MEARDLLSLWRFFLESQIDPERFDPDLSLEIDLILLQETERCV